MKCLNRSTFTLLVLKIPSKSLIQSREKGLKFHLSSGEESENGSFGANDSNVPGKSEL